MAGLLDENPYGRPVPAIVLAGSRPGKDPLTLWAGAPFKAAIEIQGRSMLERVCGALLASPLIGDVHVLCQQPDRIRAALGPLAGQSRLHLTHCADTIADTLLAALGEGGLPPPVLITTADHALLSVEMIHQFLVRSKLRPVDLAIGLVERATLHRRYPGNRRTWLKFSDGWFTGANLFLVLDRRMVTGLRFWRTIEQERKKGWKLAAAFGPGLLLRFLLRRLTLARGLGLAGRKLGIEVAPAVLDIAEAAIDVDKPSDYQLADIILQARARGG